MFFPILYKRNSNGSIQTWQIEVEDNKYRTYSGQYEGQIVTTDWTTCSGKNLGRTNETSAEKQTLKEAQALINKRKKEKYFEDINLIDQNIFFEPMLAQSYSKPNIKTGKPELTNFAKKVFTCTTFSEPKLDGIRCVLSRSGAFSRKGNRFFSVPHILEVFVPFFKENPDIILDGELYNHDLKEDFNEIVSLIKKIDPTESELEKSRETIQYWIYDCFDPKNPNASYGDRYLFIKRLVDSLKNVSTQIIPANIVVNQKELDFYFEQYLKDKYEGQIIRLEGGYENKRSATLLKRKEFIDEEYEIVDILAGKGNRSKIASSVVFRDKKGNIFSACPIGNFKYCKKLLLDKEYIIGKFGTVRYQNLTPGENGVPRFAKMVTVRDYE